MTCSFAVWGCKNYRDGAIYNEKSDNFIKDLHINFWNVSSHEMNCLDFGIVFKSAENRSIKRNGAICIFIPFKKQRKDFVDLSDNLDKSRDLVTAVFNEYLLETKNIASKFLSLKLAQKGVIIMNMKLDFINGNLDHRVTINERDDGTLLVFKLKECLSPEPNSDHYIRFRFILNESETSSLVKSIIPKDHFLKSSIDRVDIVDFRVNEQRNLPTEISSTLAGAACTPQKYHFFIIRDINDECSLTGSLYQGCRVLESETWSKYFPKDISFGNKRDPMIYHWKSKVSKDDGIKRLTDFSAVVKFKQSKARKAKIILYIFYGLAISLVMKSIPPTGDLFWYAVTTSAVFWVGYLCYNLLKYKD